MIIYSRHNALFIVYIHVLLGVIIVEQKFTVSEG